MNKAAALIALLVFVLIGLVAGIVALVATKQKLCTSPECVVAASAIIQSLNTRASPCENFYEYSCGGFAESAKVNNISSMYDVWTKKAKRKFEKFLSAKPNKDDSQALKNLKYFYKSCKDGDENSLELMSDIFADYGGWAIKEGGWRKRHFDWTAMVIRLRQQGLFFGSILEFEGSLGDNTILWISHAEKYVPTEQTAKQDLINHMGKVVEVFTKDPNSSFALAEEIFNFTSSLQDIYVKNDNIASNESLQNDDATIDELQAKYPKVKWLQFINAIVYPATFNKERRIALTTWFTMDDLLKLIEDTPKRIVSNFMLWEVLVNLRDWMPEHLRGDILKTLKPTEKSSMDKDCTAAVTSTYANVAEILYAEHVSSSYNYGTIRSLFKRIKDKYRQVLQANFTWMDQSTKSYALKKFEAIDLVIGGSSSTAQVTLDDLPYSNVDLIEYDNYIRAVARAAYESTNLKFAALNQTKEQSTKLDVISFAQNVNLYYYQSNQVIITPAMLPFVTLGEDSPAFLQYGMLGFLMAHEISHAFHSMFNWVGFDGEHHDWWSNQTESNFEEKTRCLVDAYENYTETEFQFKLSGSRALEENICDMVGLHVAYETFKELNDESLKLPGLQNYTNAQLFWLRYAGFYCNVKDGEDLANLDDKWHGISSFRTQYPASQLSHFAEDFGCPAGSRMNPADTCIVF